MFKRPSIFNSVIALVLSLVNIYTAQNGHWSVTAIVTICIIGICVTVMGSMLLVHELWFLRKLRQLP